MSAFNILLHPADVGGCGHYRMYWPSWFVRTIRKDIRTIESTKLIPIPNFYKDLRLVRVQRQISDEQCGYILNFLKPLSERIGFWLSYEIDDVIGMDDIPKYNSGWEAYQNPQLMANVQKILSVCDIVTVTTKTLGQYYIKKFGVPKDNIAIIPNYLPKWWIDGVYDLDKISKRFDEMQTRKPRIAFASSTTHFDIFNRTGGEDDFTHVNDFILSTLDKYEWVFIGGVPQKLNEAHQKGLVKYIPGYDILNYPKEMAKLNFDLVIAPLRDNVFNRCKSNIKFIEMAAMGIPAICQNLDPYQGLTESLFNTSNDLQNWIDKLLSNKKAYMDKIKHDRNVVDNGDKNAPRGWWLENNMDKWIDLYTINQRTISFDLNQIQQQQAQPQQQPVDVISTDEIQFKKG
jgi:hypothetical protein